MMSICKNLTYRPQSTDPITPSIRAADVMPFTVDAAADAVTENPSSLRPTKSHIPDQHSTSIRFGKQY